MLSVSFSLVGGDADALLSSGAAALLRLAAADLTGVPDADARFSVVEVRVGNASAAVLQNGLSNSANDTAAASSAFSGTPLTLVSRTVVADSPDWNAPLPGSGGRLRRLQGGGCGTLPINSGAAFISTPVVTAQLVISIPAAYLASIGAVTPAAVQAALAAVSATFATSLNTPATAAAALNSTVSSWASCTGLPPLLGVVASVQQQGAEVVIPATSNTDSVALPLILGLFGGLMVLGIGAAAAAMGSAVGSGSDSHDGPFHPHHSAPGHRGGGANFIPSVSLNGYSGMLGSGYLVASAQAGAISSAVIVPSHRGGDGDGGRDASESEVLLLSNQQVRACVSTT